MNYPLKALAVKDHRPFEFTLKDAPILLSNNTFGLENKPSSPIMTIDSLQRGLDIPHLFSGDYVRYEGKEYLVSYDRGLVGRDRQGNRVYFDNPDKIEILLDTYQPEKIGFEMSTKLKRLTFRAKGEIFCFDDLYGMYKGKLIVSKKKGLFFFPEQVQQYAGFRLNNEQIFFDRDIKVSNGQIIYQGLNITKERIER